MLPMKIIFKQYDVTVKLLPFGTIQREELSEVMSFKEKNIFN